MSARHSIAFGLLLLATGCTAAASPATAPVVDAPPEAVVRISGSGAALPLVQKLADAYQRDHPAARFAIDAGTNSGGGIQGVLQGTLDMSVANRPLTESEAAAGLDVQPFARDAVGFAVQQSSPIRGLTTAQVRQIYAGSVGDWQALGGSPGLVMVLDRDPDEPMRSLVLLKLLDGQPVGARTSVLTRAVDMASTIGALPDSIGYTTLALLHILAVHDVRVLTLDGVTPGSESVANGTYPWLLTYSLINRPDPPLEVQRFLAFSRGPQALAVLQAVDVATSTPS